MRCKILCEARCHIRRKAFETEDVEIVFEVVEFDDAPKRILLGANHKIFIAFAVSFGYGQNAVNYRLREPFGKKKSGSDVGVFDRIVQESDHLFFICTATHGNTHWMLKICAPHLVALPCVLRYADKRCFIKQFCIFFVIHLFQVVY